jgi:hypothetical protein
VAAAAVAAAPADAAAMVYRKKRKQPMGAAGSDAWNKHRAATTILFRDDTVHLLPQSPPKVESMDAPCP